MKASPNAWVQQSTAEMLPQAVLRSWNTIHKLVCFKASGRLTLGLSKIILVSSLQHFIFIFWMMPWSSGWILDIVFFSNKRAQILPSWLTRVLARGWAGQLSSSRTALGSSPWQWRVVVLTSFIWTSWKPLTWSPICTYWRNGKLMAYQDKSYRGSKGFSKEEGGGKINLWIARHPQGQK